MATTKKTTPKAAKGETVKATPEQKAAKFKMIATRRVAKLINGIGNLGNLSNRSAYNYTDAQIDKIFAALTDKLKASRDKFKPVEKKGAETFSID